MTELTLTEGIIFGLGNPLLDMSCSVKPDFLKKYELFANNSILGEEKHKNLVDEIVAKYKVELFAGGAVQNSLRVMQWYFDKPNYATFMGAIGEDEFGKQLAKKMKEDGINAIYMTVKNAKTGVCACLISDGGKNRSLCAFLRASLSFKIEHLLDNYEYVEKARVFYVSGFHLAVSPDSIFNLAQHVTKNPGKVFCFNLSATYAIKSYATDLMKIYPYIDILFGNDAEAREFSELMTWPSFDLKEIVGLIADKDTDLKKKGRKVIITQGKSKILLGITSNSHVKEFDAIKLKDSQIIDTNGAGDAFVGGFFAQFIQNESIDICIKSGIYAASQVIQLWGCTFPKKNNFKK